MRLLLLNDHYFAENLRYSGIELLTVGCGALADVRFDPSVDTIPRILDRTGFRPDAVLQVDSIDTRVFYRGIEELDCPTAFYAVDTPINEFWQYHYANAFDRIYVDQYKQWREWCTNGVYWARWLPLAADHLTFYPPEPGSRRDLPIVFVGTLDCALRPKRSAIIHRLRRIADVRVVDGKGVRSEPSQSVAALYRRAVMVLNENLFDGINLRTFEAMSTGAVVLTERGRGSERLFREGQHLVTFDQDDLEHVVLQLLENPDEQRRISETGIKCIRNKHTIAHRTAHLLQDIAGLTTRPERKQVSSKNEILWGVWQASCKWRNGFRYECEYSLQALASKAECLDPFRQVELFEGRGEIKAAMVLLCDLLDNNPDEKRAIATLATLAIRQRDLPAARSLLGTAPESTAANLHVQIGTLLEDIGFTLTPGFNRNGYPSSGWTAFEHYNRALALDLNNHAALEGLDRILARHGASEFSLPLWQRFHAHHPDHTGSEKTLIKRAREGYLLPVPVRPSGIVRPETSEFQWHDNQQHSRVIPSTRVAG